MAVVVVEIGLPPFTVNDDQNYAQRMLRGWGERKGRKWWILFTLRDVYPHDYSTTKFLAKKQKFPNTQSNWLS